MTIWIVIGVVTALAIVGYKLYRAGHETGQDEAEIRGWIDRQGTIDAINEYNRALDEKAQKDRRNNSGDDDSQPWVRPEDRSG